MDGVAFFDQVLAAFDEAVSKAGAVEAYFSIAGQPVRLRFAGPALVPLVTPALTHLAIEAAPNPMFTVLVWDSASTGVRMPPRPWRLEDFQVGGEVHGLTDGQVQVVFQFGPSILNLFDHARQLAVYWVKSADQIPYYESAAPLRILMQLWTAGQGVQMVHAGAVGVAAGGVLLAGKGGSGKSNTALACLASDLRYASDDFCMVASEPTPQVFSLYSTGKTRPADVERLPFLQPLLRDGGQATEKEVYYLHDHWPDKIIRQFPLRAILAPHVTGQAHTTVRPASPAEMLTVIAPSTMILSPRWARHTFQTLGRLVRQTPCYHLDLGVDMTAIPAVIQDLLQETRAA